MVQAQHLVPALAIPSTLETKAIAIKISLTVPALKVKFARRFIYILNNENSALQSIFFRGLDYMGEVNNIMNLFSRKDCLRQYLQLGVIQ